MIAVVTRVQRPFDCGRPVMPLSSLPLGSLRMAAQRRQRFTNAYYRDIHRDYRPLGHDEVVRLMAVVRGPDPAAAIAARNQLIESLLPLVVSIAEAFRRRLARRIRDVDALISDGNLGLFRAIEKYDPVKSKLTTYAGRWIVGHFMSALKNDSLVHVPAYLHHAPGAHVAACANRLARFNANQAAAASALNMKPLGAGDEDDCLRCNRTGRECEAAGDEEERAAEAAAVRKALTEHVDALPDFERAVIRGVLDGETLIAIAARMGRSREAVNYGKRRGIELLRRAFGVAAGVAATIEPQAEPMPRMSVSLGKRDAAGVAA